MTTETQVDVKTTHQESIQSISVKPREQRHVWTTLNYYADPGDGSLPIPVYVGGNTVTNERPTAPTSVLVHDITNDEAKYTLDTHGFQLVQHKYENNGFDNDKLIEKEYYPECSRLYRQITTCSQVHIFGHLVRRGPSHWHALGSGNALKKGPLHRVHVDQSYDGAELVLHKFPDLATTLLPPTSTRRWAIVNLWRPLNTIYKDPLAVAAASTIAEGDLVEAQVIYTNKAPPLNVNKTWSVRPSEKHQWYYKNEMESGEVLLIKCFDSKDDGVVRRTPHCAFVDEERSGEKWADRESVEVRAVLVWDE